MERNEHITDLVAAVEARLTSLCPLLAAVSRSQATSYEQMAALTTKLQLLPAGVVMLGPMETEDDADGLAVGVRRVHLGVLVVGDYDAGEDAGTADFWAVLDQVHDCFTPTAERGECTVHPVAVCGEQQGENRGTLLVPEGLEPVEAGKGRCAGVYRLLCLDTVAERTSYIWYLDGGDPSSLYGAAIGA